MKFNCILCPLDGSENADKALDLAIDLAGVHHARLLLLHVLLNNANLEELRQFAELEGLSKHHGAKLRGLSAVDSRLETGISFASDPISPDLLSEVGQSILGSAKRKAKSAGVENVETFLTDGTPQKQIVKCAAQEGVDCIVMGRRGLGDAAAVVLGSVSSIINQRVDCTCITVK